MPTPDGPTALPPERLLARVEEWLVRQGRFAANPTALMDGLCSRLVAEGLGIVRMNIQLRTLHPEVEVLLYVWRPGGATVPLNAAARIVEFTTESCSAGVVEQVSLAHGAFTSGPFRASPFFAIHNGASRVRCRIDPGAEHFEYPILENIRALGGTDYVAFPARFNDGAVSALSWVTARPGGFRDEEVDALEGIVPALVLCLEIHAARHSTRTLLTTYVGRNAGERVLEGKIRRGDVERIEAAIWFSDMRGFTQLSASLDSGELIRWLNDYFGAIAGPIAGAGGEILKFIGDAVLAVFPTSANRPAADVCARALEAARGANVALDALNVQRLERGLPALDHGIALHFGEVQYGNIGAEGRLDFTVIGQAVNLASRIEGLCGKLGRRTLASSAVAARVGDALESMGTFELKGIGEPQDVFGL